MRLKIIRGNECNNIHKSAHNNYSISNTNIFVEVFIKICIWLITRILLLNHFYPSASSVSHRIIRCVPITIVRIIIIITSHYSFFVAILEYLYSYTPVVSVWCILYKTHPHIVVIESIAQIPIVHCRGKIYELLSLCVLTSGTSRPRSRRRRRRRPARIHRAKKRNNIIFIVVITVECTGW